VADDFAERLTARALDDRSAAYRWLWKRRSEIAEVFAKQGRRWKALARTAADEGLTFDPNDLRKSWLRLHNDLRKEGLAETPRETPVASKAETVPAVPTHQPPEPTRTPTSPPSPDDDDYKEVQVLGADGKLTNVRIRKR
jgi:hypothetical protein